MWGKIRYNLRRLKRHWKIYLTALGVAVTASWALTYLPDSDQPTSGSAPVTEAVELEKLLTQIYEKMGSEKVVETLGKLVIGKHVTFKGNVGGIAREVQVEPYKDGYRLKSGDKEAYAQRLGRFGVVGPYSVKLFDKYGGLIDEGHGKIAKMEKEGKNARETYGVEWKGGYLEIGGLEK